MISSIPIRPAFLVLVAFLLVVPVVVVRSETALSFPSLGSSTGSRPDDSIRNLQNVTDDNVNDVQNNVTDNVNVQNNITDDDSVDGDKEDLLQDEYLQCKNDSDKFLDANPSITEGVNQTESIAQQWLLPSSGTVVGLTTVFLPGPMHAAGPICEHAGGILAKSGNYQFQCVVEDALLEILELGGLDPNATVTANYMYVNGLELCFANTEACNNIASSGHLLSHRIKDDSGWDCKAMTEVGYDHFDDPRSVISITFSSAGTPQHHPWTMGTLAAFVVMPAAAGIAMTALGL